MIIDMDKSTDPYFSRFLTKKQKYKLLPTKIFSIAFTLSKHTLSPKVMFGNVRWVFICFVVMLSFSQPVVYYTKGVSFFIFMHKPSSNFFLDILNNRRRSLSDPQNNKLNSKSLFFIYFYCVFPMQNNKHKKKS